MSNQSFYLFCRPFYCAFLALTLLLNSQVSFAESSCDDMVSIACLSQVNLSLGPSGTATITPETVAEIFGDVSTLDFLTVTPNSFDCDDVGTNFAYTVSWSDGGIVNSCFGNILIEDKISPLIACNATVNISLDADGVVELTSDMLLNFTSDNCPLTFSVTPASVSCADIGTPVTAVITATDSGGNMNSCFTTVIVEDKQGPFMACSSLINISLDSDGVVELTSDILLDFVSDNCPLTFSITPASVSCADIGTPVNAVITATDAGGNTTSCFTTINVEDKQGPTAVCNAMITVDLAGMFTDTIEVADIDAGSYDNCDITSFSLSQSVFTTLDIGTNTVLLNVEDASGNFNQCFTTVEVINSAYCPARGLSTNREYIKRVRFRGFNNRSNDNGGYADFTAFVASVRPGRSHNIRLKPGFNGASRRQFWTVWIDWNQNNVFEPSELVAAEASSENVTASIAIPASAPTGTTRMRVMMKRRGFGAACDEFAKGEVEDYSVFVEPSSAPIVSNPNALANGLSNQQAVSPSLGDQLNVYPNPAKEALYVEVPKALGHSQIVIYNLIGQKVYQQAEELEASQLLQVSLDGLHQGTYLLVVQSADGARQTHTFIKN